MITSVIRQIPFSIIHLSRLPDLGIRKFIKGYDSSIDRKTILISWVMGMFLPVMWTSQEYLLSRRLNKKERLLLVVIAASLRPYDSIFDHFPNQNSIEKIDRILLDCATSFL